MSTVANKQTNLSISISTQLYDLLKLKKLLDEIAKDRSVS